MAQGPTFQFSIAQGQHEQYRYEIIGGETTSGTLKIYIPDGQSVKAIPGCMVATSPNVTIEGKFKKTLKALIEPDGSRYQVFTANGNDEWVLLAPKFLGSIKAIDVKDAEICLGDKAFFASVGAIESTVVRQGLKSSVFSGHGMFVKKVKGNGTVFISAVGSIFTMNLKENERVVVDNGHLISWPRAMKYDIERASKSWVATGLSGEGMVCKINGPGRIDVQTRSGKDVASYIQDQAMN